MGLERSDIDLIVEYSGGRTEAAAKLGISPTTLRRWETGVVKPRARHEGVARQLLNEARQGSIFDRRVEKRESDLDLFRSGIRDALHRLREALHAHGRLSSRHEALDEVSTLLLAHSISGLSGSSTLMAEVRHRVANRSIPLAAGLRDAVESALKTDLASCEGCSLGVEDFALQITDSEDKLAQLYLDILSDIPALPFTARGAHPPTCAFDMMSHLFGQFISDSFQHERELGQYLTPEEVVQAMVELALADLDPNEQAMLISESPQEFGLVLDPSCGVASFHTHFVHALLPRAQESMSDSKLSLWLQALWERVLVGVDKSPRMLKLALASMTLFGAKTASLHLANALDRSKNAAPILGRLEGSAGLILTNPPFGAEFGGEDLKGYAIACAGRSRRTINSEVLFIERHLDWLREGGRLLTVVPDSILYNKGIYASLREMLRGRASLRAVVSLPTVAFGLAGTQTKTSILFMRKEVGVRAAPTYFFVSQSLGFDVVTKDSHRSRVPAGENDLPTALAEYQTRGSSSEIRVGRFEYSVDTCHRWDASYHAGLSKTFQALVDDEGALGVLRVRDVARISNKRSDPRRSASVSFKYIEISGVESSTLRVEAKDVPRDKTPSRARKLVEAGDVLVSTVRPALRTVGVVPRELGSSICTTGLAVLRPYGIDPYLLARLLQTDAVVTQLIRNNVGIAYPSFEEDILLDVVLPINREDFEDMQQRSARARLAIEEAERVRRETDAYINMSVSSWFMDKQ